MRYGSREAAIRWLDPVVRISFSFMPHAAELLF